MSKYHKAKKHLGQHFLHDPIVINKIITALQLQAEDCLVEIGPGLGALTFPLLEQQIFDQFSVVEVDRDVITHLQQHPTAAKLLNIHHHDALKFDFSALLTSKRSAKIVGNLPYNISTPLLFHLLGYAAHIDSMHFMLQKEVVDRIVAPPGGKNYGRLSVMIQYYCHTEYLFHVGRGAFRPPPKVESAVLRLQPWQQLPYPAKDEVVFANIVRQAFSQRRKTVKNTLKKQLSRQQILAVGIEPSLRPEKLSVADYVKLADQYLCA